MWNGSLGSLTWANFSDSVASAGALNKAVAIPTAADSHGVRMALLTVIRDLLQIRAGGLEPIAVA